MRRYYISDTITPVGSILFADKLSHVGRSFRSNEKMQLVGAKVKTMPVYKIFGLLFTTKLSRSSEKYKLASQAKKAIFPIKSYHRQFEYFLHTKCFLIQTDSYIWLTKYSEIIENVHLQYCLELLV